MAAGQTNRGLVALWALAASLLLLGAAALAGFTHGLHLEVVELQERFDAIQQAQSGGLYMHCLDEANGVQCRWILPPLSTDGGS